MSSIDGENFDTELARKYQEIDDDLMAEKAELQMKYLEDNRKISARQKTNFKMGVAEGLPKEAWALHLKLHRTKNKHALQIDNILAAEEDETIETAEMIAEALGGDAGLDGSPLGSFAKEQAEGKAKAKTAAPRKKRGKGDSNDAAPAAAKADPVGSILSDEIPADPDPDEAEEDVRPAFLRREPTQAEKNADLLRAGIKPLN